VQLAIKIAPGSMSTCPRR